MNAPALSPRLLNATAVLVVGFTSTVVLDLIDVGGPIERRLACAIRSSDSFVNGTVCPVEIGTFSVIAPFAVVAVPLILIPGVAKRSGSV